jgi:signal transduction histidine kinase
VSEVDQQERSERMRIAEVIERRSEDIIHRWLQRVREEAAAADASITDLRDGVGEYLRRLAHLMRSTTTLERAGSSTWGDIASEHALTRVQLGFDVTQLTHELAQLRRETYGVLKEEGLAHLAHAERLLALIDDAMAATLQSYVDFRDYETRRVEAEHIGFLTHELKSPLAAASLAVEHLREQDLTPQLRRSCDVLDRNFERIRHMIDDALLSERLAIGEVEARVVKLTLEKFLEDTLATHQRAAIEKRIGFAVELDPKLELHADPALTLSAIDNLIGNAIKFTDRGTVTFSVEDRPEEVQFHVRDQCGGLSPAELRVIFEPFKRAHSAKPGSGLGLAIARRAIETQGGTMHAESQASGCHFWFTLPKTHH